MLEHEEINHNNHGTGWPLMSLDSKVFSQKLYLQSICFQQCQLDITAVSISQKMIPPVFTYTIILAEFMGFGKNFSFDFNDIDFENMELDTQEPINQDHLSIPFDYEKAFTEVDLSAFTMIGITTFK